jgi:hypothetical protein
MAQAIILRSITQETRVQFGTKLSGICREETGISTGFVSNIFGFPLSVSLTSSPFSLTHSSRIRYILLSTDSISIKHT